MGETTSKKHAPILVKRWMNFGYLVEYGSTDVLQVTILNPRLNVYWIFEQYICWRRHVFELSRAWLQNLDDDQPTRLTKFVAHFY